MCLVCPHVCSMFARAHEPSNPGLVKNGHPAPDTEACAPPCRRHPTPLDQWFRPSPRGPGRHSEAPLSMPSRSVRSAGNRHSCGDAALVPRVRLAGCLRGMRRAAARRSQAVALSARLRPKRQVRWAFLAGGGLVRAADRCGSDSTEPTRGCAAGALCRCDQPVALALPGV
jgi:hypothetical protein